MQKKNIPYIISYFIMVLFFFLAAMFYRQSFLAILFLFSVILPVLSLLVSTLAVRKISISCQALTPSVTVENPIRIGIDLTNKTFVPLLNGEFSFSYENKYYPNDTTHFLSVPTEAKRVEHYELPFETIYAGMFYFKIHSFTVTDFLHLHTYEIKIEKQFEIPILPKEDPIDFFIPTTAKRESDDEDIFLPQGEQTGDVKELREYRPGDKLKDIHWKLSAKVDDLMVKEFEKAAGYILTIIPDLYEGELQDTLSLFYDVCKALLKQREVFEVGIYHPEDQSFSFFLVTEEEHLIKAIYELFYATKTGSKNQALSMLKERMSDASGVMQILGSRVIVDGNAIFTREKGK